MKKVLNKIQKMFTLVLTCLFAGVLFCSCGKTESTYVVSGYVYDELGVAVADAEISGKFGTVYTDENGKYEISGVSSSLIITASADGYTFADKTKTIYTATNEANFTAYKNYTVTGVIENNGVCVSGASVEIVSLTGTLLTTSASDGSFTAQNVAGTAEINSYLGDITFYPVTASLISPNVTIDVLSSITINLNFDVEPTDYDGISVAADGKTYSLSGNQIVLEGISCGTIITLSSDDYVFSKYSFVVSNLNQVENIDANLVYYVSGQALSGETKLADASVYVDNVYVCKTNSNGDFHLTGLTGSHTLDVVLDDLVFETAQVSAENAGETYLLYGTKDITIKFETDYDAGSDFSAEIENAFSSSVQVSKVSDNEYGVLNASFGDTILLGSEKYHLSQSLIAVSTESSYTVSCNALYTLSVSVSSVDETDANEINYLVLVDGNLTDENGADYVAGGSVLYGTHTVTASYSDENGEYVFSTAQVSYENQTANITYQTPYTVSLYVHSGEIILGEDYLTYAVIGEYSDSELESATKYYADDNGEISFSLTGTATISVYALCFDSAKISVSYSGNAGSESAVDVNLTYTISGEIACGDLAVYGVSIYLGKYENDNTTYSETASATTDQDGKFEISGLYGGYELKFEKDYYTFEYSKSVIYFETSVSVSATYSISGTLTDSDGEAISGYTVYLYYSDETNFGVLYESDVSDDSGKYSFSELSGSFYVLVKNGEELTSLKPDNYDISTGGVYDFSMSGFSVSGYVLSDGIAVSGAYVTALSSTVQTDANGYFEFKLLTQACDITVQKTGWSFSSVTVSEDATNLEISGTYTVSGTASVSNKNLANASVYVGTADENGLVTYLETASATTDENGEFTLSNLSGEKYIYLVLDGYVFSAVLVYGYSELELEPQIIVNISVLTGDVQVYGFSVYADGTLLETASDDEYSLTITVEYGTILTVSKTGYEIQGTLTVTEPKVYNFTATYSIFGSAMSDITPVANASVYVGTAGENGQVTYLETASATTDENGEFEISGLSGNVVICIVKNGYVFSITQDQIASETATISGYTNNLSFTATYTVSGAVYFGGAALSGVSVSISYADGGSETATTDENGAFSFSGIAGEYSLEFEKDTYTFTEISDNFGTDAVQVIAYFTLSGTVCSDDILIGGAEVLAIVSGSSQTYSAMTDASGNFEISGLSGTVTLIVSADGYTSIELSSTYEDNTSGIVASLTYSITLTFDTNSVIISVYKNDNFITTYTSSSSSYTVTIENLSGTGYKFTFSKSDTNFSPTYVSVNGPATYSTIYSTKSYSIYGYVTTTTGGVAASNVTVKAGTSTTTTDANGYYSFENVSGNVYISETTYESSKQSISASTEYDFTISDLDFAYILYYNGYAKLDSASYVQIYGSGTVKAVTSAMTTTQNVSYAYVKDASGNTLKENKNTGDVISILGITADANVGLLVSKYGGSYYYQQNSGSSYVSDGNVQYTFPLGGTTSSALKSTYGATAEEYSAYNVSSSTMKNVSISYSNGVYTLYFELDTSSQSNYQSQISSLSPSGTTFKSFTSLAQTYTISSSGDISKYVATDVYVVNNTLNATTTSSITYTFYSNQITVPDITSSSTSSVQSVLTYSATYSGSHQTIGDVVTMVIYGS